MALLKMKLKSFTAKNKHLKVELSKFTKGKSNNNAKINKKTSR